MDGVGEIFDKLADCTGGLNETMNKIIDKAAMAIDLISKLSLKGLEEIVRTVVQLIETVIKKTLKFIHDVLALRNPHEAVFRLQKTLDERFIKCFQDFTQDTIDGMATYKYGLKGEAIDAYHRLTGKQVKAVQDVKKAGTDLSNGLEGIINAHRAFVFGVIAAVISFIAGAIAIGLSCIPPATPSAPAVAASVITAIASAIAAAIGLYNAAYSGINEKMRAILQIETLGMPRWPDSNLDYQGD